MESDGRILCACVLFELAYVYVYLSLYIYICVVWCVLWSQDPSWPNLWGMARVDVRASLVWSARARCAESGGLRARVWGSKRVLELKV